MSDSEPPSSSSSIFGSLVIPSIEFDANDSIAQVPDSTLDEKPSSSDEEASSDSETSSSDDEEVADKEGDDHLTPIDECPILSFHDDTEDLYLKVKTSDGNDDTVKTVLYHVLCANFASASPTWRQFIYGGEHPRPLTGKWIIDMSDDDSYGLKVLLSVVHYQFHDIPEHPSVDNLYRIALMADKYKCIHLLRPYLKAWIDGLNRALVLAKEQTGEDNKVLFVTWALGDLRWFPKILNRVIEQASIALDGSLHDEDRQDWHASPFPQQIVDLIKKTRQRKIDLIFSAIKTPVENILRQLNIGGNAYCRAKDPEEQTRCEHAQLGSMLQGLTFVGLYPFDTAQPYRGSIGDLARSILSVKVSKLGVQGAKPHLDPHSGCSPGHKTLIATYQAKLPDLTAYAFTHLLKQAKASGVYDLLEEYFENPDFKDIWANDPAGAGGMKHDNLMLCNEYLDMKRKHNSSSGGDETRAGKSAGPGVGEGEGAQGASGEGAY